MTQAADPTFRASGRMSIEVDVIPVGRQSSRQTRIEWQAGLGSGEQSADRRVIETIQR